MFNFSLKKKGTIRKYFYMKISDTNNVDENKANYGIVFKVIIKITQCKFSGKWLYCSSKIFKDSKTMLLGNLHYHGVPGSWTDRLDQLS